MTTAQFQPETRGLPIGRVNNDNTGFVATIDWDSGAGKFTLIPSYRDAKADYVHYSAGFPVLDTEDYKTKALEARYASPDQYALRGVVGVYYFKEDGSFSLYSNPTNGLFQVTAPPLSGYP